MFFDGASAKTEWGTLGEPEISGSACLVHVLETPVATLRHAYFEAGGATAQHRHECTSLFYGVGGPCLTLEPDRVPAIIARRLTFHPAGYEHSLRFLGNTHVLTVEFPKFGPDGHEYRWPNASMPLPATLYELLWSAMLRIANGEPQQSIDDGLSRLILFSETYLSRQPAEWLVAVIDYIHTTWRDVQSASFLASRCNVSPEYLCRAFKTHLGVSIQQYSVLLRLDVARELLWGTDMPISELATETGFADQSHLTRVLARYSGTTPARLRGLAPCLDRRMLVRDFAPSHL